MLRFFGGKPRPARAPVSDAFPVASRDYLHSPDWEPHASGPMHPDVYASRFPLEGNNASNTLYTVVNRGGENLTGQQLWLPGPLPPGSKLYDCYHGTELKPEAPVPHPLPPEPVVPPGYNLYEGKNSYVGHGAGRDIDVSPATGLSVSQCTARCDADDQCDCVTFAPEGGKCWKRASCEPSLFDDSRAYDVYKTRAGYTLWPSANAYALHGAVEIDTNPAPGALSVAQCMSRCDADAECSCVTYLPSKKQCWKRAQCVPTEFDVSSDVYETYVRESLQPRCTGNCRGRPVPAPNESVAVSFDLEADGFDACWCQRQRLDRRLRSPESPGHAEMTKGAPPLFGRHMKYLLQTRVPIARTKPAGSGRPLALLIPQNKSWLFNVSL